MSDAGRHPVLRKDLPPAQRASGPRFEQRQQRDGGGARADALPQRVLPRDLAPGAAHSASASQILRRVELVYDG